MIQGILGVESELEDRAVLETTFLCYRVGSWVWLAAVEYVTLLQRFTLGVTAMYYD